MPPTIIDAYGWAAYNPPMVADIGRAEFCAGRKKKTRKIQERGRIDNGKYKFSQKNDTQNSAPIGT